MLKKHCVRHHCDYWVSSRHKVRELPTYTLNYPEGTQKSEVPDFSQWLSGLILGCTERCGHFPMPLGKSRELSEVVWSFLRLDVPHRCFYCTPRVLSNSGVLPFIACCLSGFRPWNLPEGFNFYPRPSKSREQVTGPLTRKAYSELTFLSSDSALLPFLEIFN